MQKGPVHGMTKRTQRRATHAGITCRPFGSGMRRSTDGVMRNVSATGSYIETSCKFKPGTVLIVRMTRFPSYLSTLHDDVCPRSIGLAEVKWLRELSEFSGTRYGMGVRYLETL